MTRRKPAKRKPEPKEAVSHVEMARSLDLAIKDEDLAYYDFELLARAQPAWADNIRTFTSEY